MFLIPLFDRIKCRDDPFHFCFVTYWDGEVRIVEKRMVVMSRTDDVISVVCEKVK